MSNPLGSHAPAFNPPVVGSSGPPPSTGTSDIHQLRHLTPAESVYRLALKEVTNSQRSFSRFIDSMINKAACGSESIATPEFSMAVEDKSTVIKVLKKLGKNIDKSPSNDWKWQSSFDACLSTMTHPGHEVRAEAMRIFEDKMPLLLDKKESYARKYADKMVELSQNPGTGTDLEKTLDQIHAYLQKHMSSICKMKAAPPSRTNPLNAIVLNCVNSLTIGESAQAIATVRTIYLVSFIHLSDEGQRAMVRKQAELQADYESDYDTDYGDTTGLISGERS